MSNVTAAEILNHVTLLHNDEELENTLAGLSRQTTPQIVSFINAHAFNLSQDKPEFAAALQRSDCLFRDGKGMEILYRLVGIRPGLNLNGTDLIPRLIKHFQARRIALLGTQEPYLSKAAALLQNFGYTVVLSMNGFRPAEDYVQAVAAEKPDLVVLGMGMPKQELVSLAIKKAVDFPCVLVNGGAILDFWGGKVRRAPRFMRNWGIEWLFRMLLEPRRLARRYMVGNYVFLRHAVKISRDPALTRPAVSVDTMGIDTSR